MCRHRCSYARPHQRRHAGVSMRNTCAHCVARTPGFKCGAVQCGVRRCGWLGGRGGKSLFMGKWLSIRPKPKLDQILEDALASAGNSIRRTRSFMTRPGLLYKGRWPGLVTAWAMRAGWAPLAPLRMDKRGGLRSLCSLRHCRAG